MNGVVSYLKVELLICSQMISALASFAFLELDCFVIKLFSVYKELNILKFESKDIRGLKFQNTFPSVHTDARTFVHISIC